MTKAQFREWLTGRFLLRLHMSLILGGTFIAGLAVTKLLYIAHLDHLALRYVVAVVAAYLTFLFLIRLWLFYVRIADDVGVDFNGDVVNFSYSGGGSGSEPVFGGQGGSFGGGGASGGWGKGSSSSGSSSKSGLSLDVGGDLDEWVVVLLIIALVLALLFIGIYVIWTAPALLSEAAFEAALAGALVKRARKVTGPGWIGVVWRATVWPFLIVLVLSGALGWAAQRRCPEATRLSDLISCRRHDQ